MLNIVKKRCYIMSDIYDEEVKSLISAAKIDCIECGIDEKFFKRNEAGKYDDQILNCITNFVKANRGNDRSDTDMYMKMYMSYRDKMTLEKKYKSDGDKNE